MIIENGGYWRSEHVPLTLERCVLHTEQILSKDDDNSSLSGITPKDLGST